MLRLSTTPGALAFAVALAACASSPPAASDGAIDAAGPQRIASPCDPNSPMPCLPTGDPCLGVLCDPRNHVCAEFPTDAGPPCGGGSAPCATSADCDEGLVCGFPVGQGCGAAGQCLDLAVVCQTDASACAPTGLACACDGGTTPYVAPGFASAPAVGTLPCPSSGASGAGVPPADAGEE
ncbi:MAG TPA: hypothetical protein VGI39_01805 [Polyangiaceae bacterium]|jgi:hypothetical protein